jgi:uncharacterized membrane protein YgcG
MLAYNLTDLNNLMIHNQVDEAADRKLVTEEEVKNIKKAYPVNYYMPNIFIRIGLFIVTLIATGALYSLLSIIMALTDDISWLLLSYSIVSFILLEIMIQKKRYYCAGVDDALLYNAISNLVGGFAVLKFISESPDSYIYISLFMAVVTTIAALRYADRWVTLASMLAWLFFIGSLWHKWIEDWRMTLPLVMIICCIILYILSKRFRHHKSLLHYRDCLRIIEIASLIGTYVFGNYYIVELWRKEISWSNTEKVPTSIDPKTETRWNTFYIVWTILVPVVYLLWGYIKKDIILLRLGVLALAASIITYHHYSDILTPEWAMVLYGALLIVLSYSLIRWLKRGVDHFTYDPYGDNAGWLEMEAMIIGGGFGGHGQAPEKGMQFGGGDFGGGGTGMKF